MSISVLIADDHEVARVGLRELLKSPAFKIVGEAHDGAEAVKKARRLKPDVVLLDVRMPGVDGLAALPQVRKAVPQARVIMLSAHDNPVLVARSVAQGASDYLVKTCTRVELASAIQSAHAGKGPSPAGKLAEISNYLHCQLEIHLDGRRFTPRESQVLRCLTLGLPNRDMGYVLDVSVETVKEHVAHVLQKFRQNDRTKVAVMALRNGISEA